MENDNKKPSFFTQLLRDQVFCGLDIGEQTVKACVVRAEDSDNLDLLGVYEQRRQDINNLQLMI